jgi:hypothetical protein
LIVTFSPACGPGHRTWICVWRDVVLVLASTVYRIVIPPDPLVSCSRTHDAPEEAVQVHPAPLVNENVTVLDPPALPKDSVFAEVSEYWQVAAPLWVTV